MDPGSLVGDVVETVERLRADPFGAVVCVDIDRAVREAEALRSELRRFGARGPLHGLAVGVKDLIDVAGFPTRAGSAVRAQARPAVRDAPAVARLRDAGAVVVAKLHTHEFGHLPTGDVAAEGPAYNPHDPARITGGSSSGSAAAVAAGYLTLAVGSDTGGSVRIPAALCGVIGVKPPYGLLPGTAMVPVAPSLDTVGLLAAGPSEAMAGRAAIAGWTGQGLDPGQSTVGMAADPYWTSAEPAVTTAVARARRRLERSGVRVVEVTTPQVEELAAAYMPILGAELYAVHARSLTVCGGLYQAETRKGLEHLAGTPASERENALRRARALSAQLARHLSGIDVLLTATTRIRATGLGARLVDVADERSTVASALLDLTLPASVTGWPAVSAPVPTPGLPAGVQLIGVGHRVDERLLLSLARTISSTPDGR